MPGQEAKFFLSYARKDAQFALKLAKDLREAGANLWVDQLDIPLGDDWDTAVERALKACGGMLLMLSPDAVTSPNVMAEVNYALEEKKRVLPVIVRKCEIPFRLRRKQHIDFTAVGEETGTAQLRAALSGPPPPAQVEVEEKSEQQAETKQPEPDARIRPEPSHAIRWRRILRWLVPPLVAGLALLAVMIVRQQQEQARQAEEAAQAKQAAEEQARREATRTQEQQAAVERKRQAELAAEEQAQAASSLLSSCTSQQWEQWIPAPAEWPEPELWGFVVDAHVQGTKVVGQVSKFSHGSAPDTHPIAHGTIDGSELRLVIGDADHGPVTYLHGTAKEYGFEVTETSMGPPMFKDDDGVGFFKLRCRPGRTGK